MERRGEEGGEGEEETETGVNRTGLVKGDGVPKEEGTSDTVCDRNSNTRQLVRKGSLQKRKI